MRKIAKIMVAALLLSMLAVSSAWADSQAVAISEAISGAPPGSEGTVLSPVITAGGQSQTDQNGGPGASAGEEQAQETQTTSTGRTIDPSKPMVALTFDDGPQTSVGNQIMDCLAQYGGKVTFFMVGERVAAHVTEVQRMVAEGHEVANHTMNHKYLQSLGASAIQSQVNASNDAIQSVCGVRPTLLRLPGGNYNATVLANTGMPMIQWNIDTLDWKTRDTASTVSKVLNNVKDGDIVLMHELYTATGNAAVQIIPELVNRGYQLVTVSEMAAAKGYTLEAGKLYSSFK
jgi:peptidoglycan/xylan/chitin deacetylase (PgdA/CDA1 family)